MSSLTFPRQSLTFRARTYTAFVFAPQLPITDWLADLDETLKRSKGFFVGHPIALDLSAVQLIPSAITDLVAKLAERNIRVLGVEGIEPSNGMVGLPPVLRGGRGSHDHELKSAANSVIAAAPTVKQQAASLLIENPVRSGQSIVFAEGDITVLGSVGSGAEIIAGGSIHIYGTLRGQALAGVDGNRRARIFCHRFEAELLAIGTHYKTADEIDKSLRRGPVQAWLDGDKLKITAMN